MDDITFNILKSILIIVKEIDIDIYHGNVFRIKMDVLVNEFFI